VGGRERASNAAETRVERIDEIDDRRPFAPVGVPAPSVTM
jgi:hypothetical protein